MGTVPAMTCPQCGYQWESLARSQKSRCGRCRSIVYVPASVRNVNTGSAPRQAAPTAPAPNVEAPSAKAPSPSRQETETFDVRFPCCGVAATVQVDAPDDGDPDAWADLAATRAQCPSCGAQHELGDVVALDDESDDEADDDDRSFRVAPSRARPYAGAPTPSAPAPAPAPRQVPAVAAAIGASAQWSCGHQGTIASAVTARDPRASRCRECGAVGLVRQLTGDGWAPVIVDAPQRPDRPAKRPGRVVAPVRFAGLVSPSQAPETLGWQPAEDRRPGAAERVPLPRLGPPR